MPDPAPITRLGPTDFYRERAAMCDNDLHAAARQLKHLLGLMYGQEETQHLTARQLGAAVAALQDRMRRSRLLLLTDDLMAEVETALDTTGPTELDALPSLPPGTVYGFQRPTSFEMPPPPSVDHTQCTTDYCEHTTTSLMSIVVPIHSSDLVFDEGEPVAAFVGYTRLLDQLALETADTGDPAIIDAIKRLQHAGQGWIPSIVHPMATPLGEHVSMERMLKLALDHGSRPVNTTPPKDAQRHAKAARVRPKAARAVRTVDLAPHYRTATTGTGTGRPLRWRSTTKSHTRTYRNPDGTIRKQIEIPSYTRAKDKPPRPPGQTPGKVTIARKPKTEGHHDH